MRAVYIHLGEYRLLFYFWDIPEKWHLSRWDVFKNNDFQPTFMGLVGKKHEHVKEINHGTKTNGTRERAMYDQWYWRNNADTI
jgi:hypothetical protein